VLAGITRIGTEAAARALVADYRDLEPGEGESTVWGIVEGVYDKPRRTTARTYPFSVVDRAGGRERSDEAAEEETGREPGRHRRHAGTVPRLRNSSRWPPASVVYVQRFRVN